MGIVSKNLLNLAAAGAALLMLAVGARGADLTLRFSSAAPPSDFLAKSIELFKAEVENAKVGVKVESYPASTLFKQGTEVPALQRGNLEMSTMTTFEVAQQIPEFGFFNRGYLFRDYDHMRHVIDGPIGDKLPARGGRQDGHRDSSPPTYLGTRQVNLRQKRTVKGPADLAGVKLRMTAGPGMAAARQVPRRQSRANGNAGGLSGAQDRRDRRPGKSALDPQRRQAL